MRYRIQTKNTHELTSWTCKYRPSRHDGRSLRSPPCQKSRTDTNRKSKQWTTPKPTQNNHPHSSRYHDFKYQIPLIWYFQPIRDHVSFSWCCLDWLSTPPFIESYCYLTVLELSTGAQQNFFFFGDQRPELNPKIIPLPLATSFTTIYPEISLAFELCHR